MDQLTSVMEKVEYNVLRLSEQRDISKEEAYMLVFASTFKDFGLSEELTQAEKKGVIKFLKRLTGIG